MIRFKKCTTFVLYTPNHSRLSNLTLTAFAKCFQNVAVQPQKANVIVNLQKNFSCSKDIAYSIYNNFPLLRSIDAIKIDTLKFLRTKVSIESIIENPLLVTLDIDDVKEKIIKLNYLEPKKLDDFYPLIGLEKDELNKLVARFLKEKDIIEQKNRIYFLSEKLKIEPKLISKYRANCGCEIFSAPFQNFKKKIDILLDYGVDPMNLLSGLYILRYDDNVFIRRIERMISVGLPIAISYFKLPEKEFDELIEKHTVEIEKLKKTVTRVARMKRVDCEEVMIVDTLKSLLNCNESESTELYYSYVNDSDKLQLAKININYLLEMKIKPETITQNGFLLAMPIDEIKEKMEILKHMQPKIIDDFIPLINISATELSQYQSHLEVYNAIGENHPIYCFSKKLKMPVNVVAMHFAKKSNNNFFKLDPTLFDAKLDVLLKHDVDKESILKCKWTFRYSANQIDSKISALKNSGLTKISSWMVFSFGDCKVNRVISNFNRDKESREGLDNNMEYIAQRLRWNETDFENARIKYPKLNNRSSSKIKNHLDYLLNENNFTESDITNSLYILNKSLDEIKARINEMKEIGMHLNLTTIYMGKMQYLKRIKEHCDNKLRCETGRMAYLTIETRIKQEKIVKNKKIN